MDSNETTGCSWWVTGNFQEALPIAQKRMRLETPSAPVARYLAEVERQDERDNLGQSRFVTKTPS